MSLRGTLRVLARPTVVLPLLLVAALLALASKLGLLEGVAGRLRALPARVWWITLACAAAYLTLKGLQLRMLLANLGVRLSWHALLLAFCVGELTVTLPLGLFSQNWVMSASERIHVGRSSAATVSMLLAEIAVVLIVLAVTGIPGWPQLRPGAVIALCVLAVLLFGVLRWQHVTLRAAARVRRPALHAALVAGIELVQCLKRLARPALAALNVVLAAAYLGTLVVAFLAVGLGLGLATLDFSRAMTIYAFALAVVLLGGGLFGQIGTVDVLGVVAGRASGIGYADAVALMLGFRVLWTAAIWLLDLPVVLALWHFMPGARSGDRRQQALH